MKIDPNEIIRINTAPDKQTFEGDDRLAIITLIHPSDYPVLLTDVVGTRIRGLCGAKSAAVEAARRWVLDGEVSDWMHDAHHASKLDNVLDWLDARLTEADAARRIMAGSDIARYNALVLAELATLTNVRAYVASLLDAVQTVDKE